MVNEIFCKKRLGRDAQAEGHVSEDSGRPEQSSSGNHASHVQRAEESVSGAGAPAVRPQHWKRVLERTRHRGEVDQEAAALRTSSHFTLAPSILVFVSSSVTE